MKNLTHPLQTVIHDEKMQRGNLNKPIIKTINEIINDSLK